MKLTIRKLIAILLVAAAVAIVPLQAAAAKGDYISEVKIGIGDDVDEAAAQLKGYTILKDGSSYADINAEANSFGAGKHNVAVLFGYKTTANKMDAVTDLAVMNMAGRFSYADFGMMVKQKMNAEVAPFLDSFVAALKEYRANYASSQEQNRVRAANAHDILNTLSDDDTGMLLGDLLLNETKYEMGEEAYNKLSGAEKKKHADLVTLLTQANGVAVLILKSAVARASDDASTNWIERMGNKTYKKMVYDTGLTPTDARKKLDKLYYDDAMLVLGMWKDFSEQLLNYNDNKKLLQELTQEDYEGYAGMVEDFELESADTQEIEDFADASMSLRENYQCLASVASFVSIKSYLESISYDGGTLLDFFTMPYEQVSAKLNLLYPFVSSLSAGQRASLNCMSLAELVMMTKQSEAVYREADLEKIGTLSVYNGMDREAFERGGVALTPGTLSESISESLHMTKEAVIVWQNIHIGNNALFTSAFMDVLKTVWNKAIMRLVSIAMPAKRIATAVISAATNKLNTFIIGAGKAEKFNQLQKCLNASLADKADAIAELTGRFKSTAFWGTTQKFEKFIEGLMEGFGVLGTIATFASAIFSFIELSNYYHIDYTPGPGFVYDTVHKQIYNSRGEAIDTESVPVCYKACVCNRSSDSEMYKILGNKSDLNGDVGKQWLTLYATKDPAMEPILASSLRVQYGSGNLPLGYKNGLHLFGSGAAMDLNNKDFDWEHGRNGIYLFFQNDSTAGASGSSFTNGTLALVAIGAFAAGAVISACVSGVIQKRKSRKKVVS